MATAYYDLNVLVDDENPSVTVRKVEQLISLGYQVVALNRIHTVCAKRKSNGKKVVKKTDVNTISPENILAMLENRPDNFKLLSRVTVLLESHEHVRELQSDYVKSFDIVAVRPTSLKLFQQVCTQIELVDIISMELDSRVPFKTGYKAFGAAVARGIFVEISYASAIRSSSLRQSVLANGIHIATRCRGRGIILSSSAEHYMEFRAPYDVANLGLLFGLTERNSKLAVTKNCYDVTLHAYSRSQTAKSVITMRRIGDPMSALESIVKMKNEDVNTGEPVMSEIPIIKQAEDLDGDQEIAML